MEINVSLFLVLTCNSWWSCSPSWLEKDHLSFNGRTSDLLYKSYFKCHKCTYLTTDLEIVENMKYFLIILHRNISLNLQIYLILSWIMFGWWILVFRSLSGSTLRWSTLQTDTSVTRCSAPRSRPPHPSARRWWPSITARGAATSQRFTLSHGTGRYTSKARPSCSPSTPGIHTAPRWTTTATETQPGADGLCPQSGWSPPRMPVHASFTQKTSERHTWEMCYPSQISKTPFG